VVLGLPATRRAGQTKKNTKLLFIVLSLYPTWIVDPDTALVTGQYDTCQSGFKSCFGCFC
jgi:hypothetical protein